MGPTMMELGPGPRDRGSWTSIRPDSGNRSASSSVGAYLVPEGLMKLTHHRARRPAGREASTPDGPQAHSKEKPKAANRLPTEGRSPRLGLFGPN